MGANRARREELEPGDSSGCRIEDDVDAPERLASRKRLDDADAVDLMGEPGVRVTRGDHVDQAGRQASGQLKDFGLGIARRQIGGAIEPIAAASGVRGDDHDFSASLPQFLRFGCDRGFERRDPQPLHVGGDRGPEPVDRHDAHDPDLDAGHVNERRRPDVGPLDRPAGRQVDQVRGEEWMPRLRRAGFQRAA